jgi:esterase
MPIERTSSHAIASDGARLAFKVAGNGTAAILFMHGWASTKDYFDSTVDALDMQDLLTIQFDVRGHGDSELGSGNYSVEQLSRDTIAIADAAGTDAFIAVGHSLGARFIQHLQVIEPARVRAQILVAGMSTDYIKYSEDELSRWVACAGSYERMLEIHQGIVARPTGNRGEIWATAASQIPSQVLAATLETGFHSSFSNQLTTQSPPPTLIVAGAADPVFPVDDLANVRLSIPGARMIVLDAGHEIPLEQPRHLARLIEAFTAGTNLPRSSK